MEDKKDPTEAETYDAIVREVKAEVAKWPREQRNGARTLWEIRRRWAQHKGEKFTEPQPPVSGPPGARARVPTQEVVAYEPGEGPEQAQPHTPDPDRKPGQPKRDSPKTV